MESPKTPEIFEAPLVTFDIFTLIGEYPLLSNRKPDAVFPMKNIICYVYDRPFLRSFLNWCSRHFTIGTTQRKGLFSEYVFGPNVRYVSPHDFVVKLNFYNPTKYDTELSENGYLRMWLQKFIDSKMSSLEEFSNTNPFIPPKPYAQGVYNPPTNSNYGQVVVPRSIEMPIFVGRDGFHLKRITELSQCEYLWFDTSRNVVEIWGRAHKILKAQRMLERRVASLVACK